jgi:lipopolysaccharide/colanic/teichoic acid biosynthesis glycosyltransferase
MLNVLRHYLPLRKALLVASELALLTAVVAGVMTLYLWPPSETTRRALAFEGLDPTDARWRVLISSFTVAVLAQLTLAFNELYDFRIASSRFERMARFLTSASSAVLLVTVVKGSIAAWNVPNALAFPALPFSNSIVLLTSALFAAFLLLFVWRHFFGLLMQGPAFRERLLILGRGRMANRLVEELGSRENSGYEVVALLTPGEDGERRRLERRRSKAAAETGNPWFEASVGTALGPAEPDEESDGDGDSSSSRILMAPRPTTTEGEAEQAIEVDDPLVDITRRLEIDQIVVAFEERRGSLPTSELMRCRMEGVRVEEAEAFYEQLSGKIPAEAMRPSYLIFNRGFDQHFLAALAKRMVDITLALIGLALTWPAMLAVAIAIRLDSPGPVLFRQERMGQGGRSFSLCKFRSMRTDAEKLTGPVWATEDDPRVTRVGRFIRKTRLDELPQLFNILAGSMSLVGPRPERPHFVAELSKKVPYYFQRHITKPGLTGWAQINYPYGNTVEDALQKLQYDLFYIKYQSTLFDLSIVFNTVKTVLLRKGT